MNSLPEGPLALSRDPQSPFRILALDVDGTLLDARGETRPRTTEAVARAARAGIRPVLCTGRRYRRARPIAELFGLDAPLVCNSGALVKEPSTHQTLWRASFSRILLAELLDVFRGRDEPALSFTDRHPADPDFLVALAPTGRRHFDDYLSRNQGHEQVDPHWTDRLEDGLHFHLCAIGTRPDMLDFARHVHARVDGRVRTFVQRSPRYLGTMCEIIPREASKWDAVLHLAAMWGITPAEICAVGDDMNDLPMIEGAGLGVAMGHAPASVRAAADLITGDLDSDGVAMVVDHLLGEIAL